MPTYAGGYLPSFSGTPNYLVVAMLGTNGIGDRLILNLSRGSARRLRPRHLILWRAVLSVCAAEAVGDPARAAACASAPDSAQSRACAPALSLALALVFRSLEILHWKAFAKAGEKLSIKVCDSLEVLANASWS